MAREIVLELVNEGISARAVLLEKQAPKTCQTIWNLLPVSGDLGHAAYSGTIVALYIDPNVIIEPENVTTCIQTGDVMYTHYDAMVRHGHPEPLSEIYWAYDRYARPTIPGQFVPAIANVFARIYDDADAFYEACRAIRRGGVKQVRISRAE